MHPESLALMDRLLDKVVETTPPDTRPDMDSPSVLDVGSFDVNGTYRKLIESRGWEYLGVDVKAGKNVQRIWDATDPEGWTKYGKTFDLIISGQMLEHCANPWKAVVNMKALLKPGAWMILIAPREIGTHCLPDRWRFLTGGMEVLLGGLDDVTVGYSEAPSVSQGRGMDCWGMGRKPSEKAKETS